MTASTNPSATRSENNDSGVLLRASVGVAAGVLVYAVTQNPGWAIAAASSVAGDV